MARKSAASLANHARLHKRENSTTSMKSPASLHSTEMPWADCYAIEPTWKESGVLEMASPKSVKIKPYLRKLSMKNEGGIDLSRPAAENEGLTGLGIDDIHISSPRTISDVTFSPIGTRTKHSRSTSNTSQFSNNSGPRPSQPYHIHPLRPTPRPYTPPVPSYANSSNGCEEDSEAHDVVYTESIRDRSLPPGPSRRSTSISSSKAPPMPPLLITSSSFTKMGTPSQSSLSIASPVAGRPRGDTLRSLDSFATAPSSRPSLDKFSLIRGRDSPLDPVSRANEIRLARQAYKEKEEAKDRKMEKEAMKKADQDARRDERKRDRQRRKEEAASKRSLSVSNEKLEYTNVIGREYGEFRPAHARSMPARVDTGLSAKRTHTTQDLSKTKKARSRWLSFIAWLRTRFLRMGHHGHSR
ncbi:hypothetical protein EJ05DRAFT_363847 [Pseudovirgaria hyperparasitica]|uniref:Uncharacterized protein n=1 Tax=Pseudovirgaria hyperparasitica TaxID=470096 RepID=A0A6A6WA01_9PEZI|nr:uncharacterized protein EJ05DRAFT_363847 [Pseudovirgaria hyperparasitica]KAF2758780.1 hypothetical protein EJ05DRAFT_363847 [Pseudovirgaria hyperparasitica]